MRVLDFSDGFSSASAPTLGQSVSTVAKTTTYTALSTDDVITVATAAAWTLTLPAAASNTGKVYQVVKTSSDLNALTIDPNGSETIGGATTTTINTLNESLIFVSDGTNWQILGRRVPSVLPAWTPTGTWSTNSTYTGFIRRYGDKALFEAKVVLAGAPDNTDLEFNLPTGYVIDTAKMAATTSRHAMISNCSFHDTGSAVWPGIMVYSSTTAIAPRSFKANGTTVDIDTNGITRTVPFTFGNTDIVICKWEVPIVGWNS